MPKLIRENPAYFIVPIFVLIIGAVFFFAEKGESASEWQRISAPEQHNLGRLNDIAVVFDEANKKYRGWAVGGDWFGTTNNYWRYQKPSIFSYDSLRGSWIADNNFSWSYTSGNNHRPSPRMTELNGISVVKKADGTFLIWAVGDVGESRGLIMHYKNWGTEAVPDFRWGYQACWNCTNGAINNPTSSPTPKISYNLYDVSFVDETNGWAVGGRFISLPVSYTAVIYKTVNGGADWTLDFSVAGNNFMSVHMTALNDGWAVGYDGLIYRYNGANWNLVSTASLGLNFGPCNVGTGTCTGNTAVSCSNSGVLDNNCILDLSDVNFIDSANGWAMINEKKYLRFQGGSWQSIDTNIPGTSLSKIFASTSIREGSDIYTWFVGTNGSIHFARNDTNWQKQLSPAGSDMYGIIALDLNHAWSVGEDRTYGFFNKSDSIILKITPGNVSGWGCLGADDCREPNSDWYCLDDENEGQGGGCQNQGCGGQPTRQPGAGWISFGCSNAETCEKEVYTYGVNIKKELLYPFVGALCEDGDTNPTASFQDNDTGSFSGNAWFGKNDPYEIPAGVTCDITNHCSNSTVSCLTTADCVCGKNPDSCYSTGWLSFNRFETGEPPACPYLFTDDKVCEEWVTPNRFKTPCNLDVPVSTSRNTITKGQLGDYTIATFDYKTYAVQGWARFKLGQCSNDGERSCYQDSGCELGQTCVYSGSGRCKNNWGLLCSSDSDCDIGNKGICDKNVCSGDKNIYCQNSLNCQADDYGPCDKAEGWVKLRGGNRLWDSEPAGTSYIDPPEVSQAGPHIYNNCNACKFINPNASANDDGDEYYICMVCDGKNVNGDNKTYACNKCAIADPAVCDSSRSDCKCGNGRCSTKIEETCVISSVPSADRCTLNLGWGSCQESGSCSSESPNKFSPCFENSDCGFNGSCLIYANNYTCNKCSLCDEYGVSTDVEGGDFYGYAWSEDFGWINLKRVSLFNITWFQTKFADIYGGGGVGTTRTAKAPGYTNPDRGCNASYLILAGNPNKIVNSCTSSYAAGGEAYRVIPSEISPQIGSFNPWLVQKYRVLSMPVSDAPQSLLGRVDYNKIISLPGVVNLLPAELLPDDLEGKVYHVAGDYRIENERLFKNGAVNGSGLIVIDGDLIINSNLTYQVTAINDLKKIASLAFYVKGDIIISYRVDSLVGSYYTEGIFRVNGVSSTDKQFNLKGLAIAKTFELGRRYKGTVDNPQPGEVFTYDGRVQLNPPPGFRDLSKALPKISEVSP